MQKYVLAALLATATLGAKIPLSKKTISKASFNEYKEKMMRPQQENGLENRLPIKNYMNT